VVATNVNYLEKEDNLHLVPLELEGLFLAWSLKLSDLSNFMICIAGQSVVSEQFVVPVVHYLCSIKNVLCRLFAVNSNPHNFQE
jgi:hypothetical protein